MPIEGRTLEEAAQKFRDHLNAVLAKTVTRTPLIMLRLKNTGLFQITFRQAGRVIEPQLKTRFGSFGLYIGQFCGSTTADHKHRLYTARYRYMLTPKDTDQPLFRWEYVRKWPAENQRWCRHHLQGNLPLLISGQRTSLNDLHLPTGYVTIEEILRFCIVDLAIKPLSRDWHGSLEESYQLFKSTFAP